MKEHKVLKWYAIIVFILLITIMFIIPDSFFLKLNTKLNKPNITEQETTDPTFLSIKEQQNNLLNNDYKYEYLMMDSMGTKTVTYECSGKKTEDEESGTCTSPENLTYTEKNKKEILSNINTDYIELEKIFALTKDIEPIELTYNKTRELIYNTKILDLETEIVFYTDLDNITQINISNAYMTYILKYNIIKD